MSKNQPFKVLDGAKSWAALKKWKSTDYLRTAFQEFEDDNLDNLRGVALYFYNNFDLLDSETLLKDIEKPAMFESIMKLESAKVEIYD